MLEGLSHPVSLWIFLVKKQKSDERQLLLCKPRSSHSNETNVSAQVVVAVKETGGQEEGDARMVNHLLQMTGPGSSWIPGCAVLAADAALPLMPWQRVRQHRRPLQTSASSAHWKRVCAERWSVEGEEGGPARSAKTSAPGRVSCWRAPASRSLAACCSAAPSVGSSGRCPSVYAGGWQTSRWPSGSAPHTWHTSSDAPAWSYKEFPQRGPSV